MNKKKRLMITVYSLLLIAIFFYSIDNVSGQITKGEYEISVEGINERIKIGNYKEFPLNIKNKRPETISVFLSLDGNVTDIIKLSDARINIEGNSEKNVNLSLFGENLGFHNGTLIISGGINEEIPINFTVSDLVGIPVEAIIMEISTMTERAYIGESFRYKIDIQNLLAGRIYNVTLHYSIDKMEDVKTYELNKSFFSETETITINTSTTLIKKFEIPDFIRSGEYVINVRASYFDLESNSNARFFIVEKVLDYRILGILPLRWLVFGVSILIVLIMIYLVHKKQIEKKKRYKSKIDFSLLPKPDPRSVKIGKIAETNIDAYFDIDQLTMHTLIAGSTGGGKTVSAEVLVEEALMKGVSVIIFDPTAQWTGFLRKNQNKKMLALYPRFGLKKTDAKAFNGNVHQILNARQILDIKKYMVPGEIHSFAINRLDPSDIDILVANTIREVFHANLPESPELKLLIIFDEVHRLLPKFGGSGQGFIQIERGAREFRKWGVGLALISQVLTDFVGETKANINTEIQMRTRDQGDLDRIKNKYGTYMLQSLLKASTGTGMIENSAYNSGNPYFVTFRPLFHEHARLSDEILENYNKYNGIIDDLDYQIDQLKEEGIDVFDIKLELKLALDKVKSGSFNMVDIYLDGLKPRLEEYWKKLGKKPKEREIKLVAQEELKKEFEKAKKAREEYEKENGEQQRTKGKEEEKTLAPLRLKTGIVVINPQELIDALNTMNDESFMQHVNDKKNDFADWIEPVNKQVADKLRKANKKHMIISILESNDIKKK
ncbi:MAG: helicase HerA-like domain-containing protein [Candidatus Woesearchaeota archaeon]